MKYLILLLLLTLFCVVGCKELDLDFGPLLFQPKEKVHYIDDPNLIGRVLYRNSYGNYWVQWLTPSSRSGFLGGSISSSRFTQRTHEPWELVSCNENN